MIDSEEASLRRLLMAWDGQWFLKVMARHGIAEAVELNRQVRRSFARIEIRELIRMRQLGPVSLAEAFAHLRDYFRVGAPGELQATFHTDGGQKAEILVSHCPALEGVKKVGLERRDWACLTCAGNWQVWTSRLLNVAEEDVSVEIPATMSAGASRCEMHLRVVGGRACGAASNNGESLG
jgi:hypothetical protein